MRAQYRATSAARLCHVTKLVAIIVDNINLDRILLLSCTKGVMRCLGTTVTLPRLGTICTHESTRKLARKLANGTARIMSATVSRTAQRWFVSFTVAVERATPAAHARPGSAIGVDLGVKALLTGADCDGNLITIPGPKPLRRSLRRLRRTSRAHSRKTPGSANRRKRTDRLARIHARVANIRADALHKAATDLAVRYQTICAEDLNVAGMVRNRKLDRVISDQGFGQALRAGGCRRAGVFPASGRRGRAGRCMLVVRAARRGRLPMDRSWP